MNILNPYRYSAAGVDLKDGLKIWSENYQSPDEHSGSSYLNLGGIPATTSNIPSPFTTAYAPNKDEGFFNEGAFAPTSFSNYTIFGVARISGAGFGRHVIGGYLDGIYAQGTNGDGWFEPAGVTGWGFRCNRTAQLNVGVTINTWTSIVMVKSGNTMTVYKNGVFVNTITGGSTTPTSFWRGFDSQKSNLLVFGISNRTWALEDAEYFHNNGSFLRYANLP